MSTNHAQESLTGGLEALHLAQPRLKRLDEEIEQLTHQLRRKQEDRSATESRARAYGDQALHAWQALNH